MSNAKAIKNNDINNVTVTEKNKIFAIIALVILSFVLGTSEFIVVAILTDISTSLNISITQASRIISIFALAYSLCSPFSAAIAGKFNRYYFMIFASMLFVLSNFLCSMADNYIFLIIMRIFTAIISGVLISVSISFIPYIAKKESRGIVVALIYSGFSISYLLGLPIGTTISYNFGWRDSFLFISISSIITMVLIALTLPRNTPRYKVKLIEQFIIVKDSRLILSSLTILFGAASSYIIYTYLNPIFIEYVHVPNDRISIALFIFGIAVLCSTLLSGKLAEKNGVYKLRFVFIFQFLFMLASPYAFNTQIGSAVIVFSVGFSIYLMTSPVQINILNFVEKDYPSCLTLSSANNSFSFNLGVALGSFIGSTIVDNYGMKWLGFGGAVMAVFAFICVVTLQHKNNKRYRYTWTTNMELLNSKTKENLKTAFIIKSIIRCKYMYYAEKAREEGMEVLASAYEKAARNEQEHGRLWFERYHGIFSKDENLKDAIMNESYESKIMYLKFAETAKNEGFNDIAALFEHVSKIEEGHKRMFEKYLTSDNEEISKWQCTKCGYMHDDINKPSKCPICG
ncbi:MFS transporter [uncultured Brachyspira sp.]|uniref:MFS transporter n=1 Tax=uncultured Brachyspira sp. TaxID=221953 RepID=UPI00345B8B47